MRIFVEKLKQQRWSPGRDFVVDRARCGKRVGFETSLDHKKRCKT